MFSSRSRNLKPSFCKIIMSDDYNIRLRFPLLWFTVYRRDLPVQCKLEMPNGLSWTVGITKTSMETYFDENWPIFVYRNNIERGHTLVFTHHGGPDFKVLRYMADGCMPDQDIVAKDLGNYRRYYPSSTESEDSDLEPHQDQSGVVSSLPAFTCVLMTSDLERGLNLPSIWWKTHIEDKDSIESATLFEMLPGPVNTFNVTFQRGRRNT
ncbi:putative B3 domain-containing protein isoform X2 [Salvia divinorum]|uniref:B3 domain-containing protein isoform X2 n=1 Tax=Salvia divinorum TaxID=28513 RepID=A0ABD1HU07_SALDI